MDTPSPRFPWWVVPAGGLLLAGILVFVINRRSFDWTMPIDVSPAILLEGVALSASQTP